MTKKDLIKIIREAVRIEVKKEVKKIFINEEPTPKLENMISSKVSKPKKQKQIKYTKDEVLNKVLNETRGGIPQQGKEEYPTLGGGAFDTSRMTELMGYGKPDEVQRDMVAVDTMKKAGVTSEQVPEHVTNALTRDYSDLMKALDKKGK
tara:strand:- start:1026 stop:1472 length:447 start_codon:yes stop_codon:yes gene_type:complete